MTTRHEGISFIELEQVSEQFIFEDRYPTDVRYVCARRPQPPWRTPPGLTDDKLASVYCI